jgi:signal transduction histidine kinase/integral membrane sensor domain MASE1
MANVASLPPSISSEPAPRVFDDLRRTLKIAFWLIVGLLLSYTYSNAALVLPNWIEAPDPLFLPQAVILSVLLLTPTRRWWVFLTLYYVVQIVQGLLLASLPLWYASLSNVANVIEPLIGAALFRRFVPEPQQFTSLRAVAIYIGAVTLGSIVGATWGAASRALAGAPFQQSWPGWFLGDVLASLVLAPTIVLWVTAGRGALRPRSRARLLEAAALLGAIVVLGWLVFGAKVDDPDRARALLYLPVPLLLWAAVRFGPRGLMTALSLVTVLAVASAAQNLGPFIGSSPSANLFTLQLFLLGIGVPLFCLAALVRERQQAQERLQQSEERYRAVVGSLPHGAVLLFGSDLRHRFAGGQGVPEIGLLETIEGRTLQESFPKEMAANLEPHYRAALAGTSESFDLTQDGRTYEAEVLPVAGADAPTGMVLLQDVTDQRRAEVLAVANVQLEQLNKAKSEWVSVVSHEFRTPLTGIQAFSELLRDEEFPAGQVREFATDINREAERLSRMIGDLLDLERMESGQMTLSLGEVDLNALVEEAITATGPGTPRHTLRRELDPTLPLLIADRDKLTQVIVNLLGNAIKYSPNGGDVTIGTSCDATLVHLWVRDQGIGIPSHDLEAIFQRYTRLESGYNVSIKGTGLGLPIVRQIAELHGGRTWAESEARVGSTFHVTLPVKGMAGAD